MMFYRLFRICTSSMDLGMFHTFFCIIVYYVEYDRGLTYYHWLNISDMEVKIKVKVFLSVFQPFLIF